MPNSLENKSSSEESQQTIQILLKQLQAFYPSTAAPQLPNLVRALHSNATNTSFHSAIIALLNHLVRLKTILNSRIKNSLLREIGEQAFSKLVLVANKFLYYHLQYPARTQDVNLLLDKVTTHMSLLTTALLSFDELDNLPADALLLLRQSEKSLEREIRSYGERFLLRRSPESKKMLEAHTFFGLFGLFFCLISCGLLLSPFIIELLPLAIVGVLFGLVISFGSFRSVYHSYKNLEAQHNIQQRNYQENLPPHLQKEVLNQLSDFQKLKEGQALLRNNNLAQALRCFSQISESNEKIYAQAMYEYGGALLVRKQYLLAIRYFTKAGDLDAAQEAATFHLLSQIEEDEEKPTADSLRLPRGLGIFSPQRARIGTLHILPEQPPRNKANVINPAY